MTPRLALADLRVRVAPLQGSDDRVRQLLPRALIGPWLGHLLVDAAIFTVGWDLVR